MSSNVGKWSSIQPPSGTPVNSRLSRIRLLAVTITIPLMVLNIVTFLVGMRLAMAGFDDFRHLYTAAYMVRSGHRHEIYDEASNREFQDRVVSYGNGRTLTFNHLAYEALLFIPLSIVRYRVSYFLFLAVNLVLLVLSFRLLRERFGQLNMPSWFVITLFLAFLPVTFALEEGQDSIILLALMAGTAVLIDDGRDFEAGVILGLTLFKFQFGVPVALLYLIWKRWRLVGGFACSGVTMLAISLWTVGAASFTHYVYSLVSSSVGLTHALETRYDIHPAAMINLRGLVYGVFDGLVSHTTAQIVLAVACIVVFVFAAISRPSFSLAITAAVLVSYHCFATDTVLLLIPLSALIGQVMRGAAERWKWILVAILIAGPTILLHAGERYYLATIAVLAFFVALPSIPFGQSDHATRPASLGCLEQ